MQLGILTCIDQEIFKMKMTPYTISAGAYWRWWRSYLG